MWIVQPETVSADGGIRVNGTDILQAQDHTVQCGSGTAKYDPDTKTLTLDHAVISGNALLYGIQIEGQGVTVELAGQNSIEAYIGIWSRAPLRIKGTGGASLAVHAVNNQALPSIACRGISIENGGLTVQDANLQIQVSSLSETVGGYAVEICGGENLISNSNIVIDMPYNFAVDYKSTGINATGAVSLTITDNSSITMKNVDMGIGMGGGSLFISGSRLAIENADESGVSCENMEIRNGSEVSAIANSGVALGVDANITISNSTVHAESTDTNSILCNDLAVTDSSKVTAKGFHPAFYVVKDTVIKDSVIEAESKNDVGMYCKEGNLEIEGSEVKSTSNQSNRGGILVKGNLTMSNSNVISPGGSGSSGIHADDDITITGGTTEIGAGSISSKNNIHIGGIVTSNGVPSYENIASNNADGQVTFLDADYRAVDEAIAKAKALNKADYTNFDTVEAAVNAVVRGKDVREQDVVDGYAAAIEAAIAGLKPLPAVSIIEGADQTFVIGNNKSVTIKADGDFSKFVGVSMDGTEIAKEHYTAAAGSTIITLKPEYLQTLTAGEHTVAIRFTDGLAQTMLTIQEEGSGNPSEKPDDPSEKPDDPSEKPENPSEKPDDPSDETGQEPTKDSSQNQTQNPAQKPSQSQENPENSPKTGDNMPVVWLIVLAALSAAGLAAGKCRRQ